MTQQQKDTIRKLRHDGHSYMSIAKTICLSVNTVKSHCRRNSLPYGNTESIATKKSVAIKRCNSPYCPQCGRELIQKLNSKPRRFCSDQCRIAWWNTHLHEVNRKALYTLQCAECGKAFESYGNQHRRYCSHVCYIANRFKKAGDAQ
jgi:endogenous inhibitor of DNA gyrase (YacG/DUF329 family)